MSKLDESRLDLANKEVEDLLAIAQFNPAERHKFITRIQKELSAKNISLDYFQ